MIDLQNLWVSSNNQSNISDKKKQHLHSRYWQTTQCKTKVSKLANEQRSGNQLEKVEEYEESIQIKTVGIFATLELKFQVLHFRFCVVLLDLDMLTALVGRQHSGPTSRAPIFIGFPTLPKKYCSECFAFLCQIKTWMTMTFRREKIRFFLAAVFRYNSVDGVQSAVIVRMKALTAFCYKVAALVMFSPLHRKNSGVFPKKFDPVAPNRKSNSPIPIAIKMKRAQYI